MAAVITATSSASPDKSGPAAGAAPVAALCAGDDAIGADDDVAVEVGINFQRGQNDVIQLVDKFRFCCLL